MTDEVIDEIMNDKPDRLNAAANARIRNSTSRELRRFEHCQFRSERFRPSSIHEAIALPTQARHHADAHLSE